MLRKRRSIATWASWKWPAFPYYYDSHERCYRVRPGFKFPVVNLTPDELLGQAAATAVVTKAAGLDAGAAATPATRKIAAASSQEVADLLADAEAVMDVLNLKLADHSRHQEMVRTVQWALIQGKQVTGQYVSPYQEKPVKLALHPYRLCFAGQAWYLIARPVEEKQPKTYRIARFQSVRMIDAAAQRPAKFDPGRVFRKRLGSLSGQGMLRGGDRVHQGGGEAGDRDPLAQDPGSP